MFQTFPTSSAAQQTRVGAGGARAPLFPSLHSPCPSSTCQTLVALPALALQDHLLPRPGTHLLPTPPGTLASLLAPCLHLVPGLCPPCCPLPGTSPRFSAWPAPGPSPALCPEVVDAALWVPVACPLLPLRQRRCDPGPSLCVVHTAPSPSRSPRGSTCETWA